MSRIKYPAKTKRSAPNGRGQVIAKIDPEVVARAFASSSDPNRKAHYAIPATALRCERISQAKSSIRSLEEAPADLLYAARLRSPLITLNGRSLFSSERRSDSDLDEF